MKSLKFVWKGNFRFQEWVFYVVVLMYVPVTWHLCVCLLWVITSRLVVGRNKLVLSVKFLDWVV